MAEDGMMTEDGIGQHRERNAASIGTQAKKPHAGLRERGQQLLPGIPDDITLSQIAPKLPWSAFHTLSFVSSCWRQAIDRREVYNARIRSQATETVVVFSHTHPEQVLDETHPEQVLDESVRKVVHGIAVYCTRDKSCYPLPGIPRIRRGIPEGCQCIVLDSRIYVVGGIQEHEHWGPSAEVYVLDLAGQRKWKRCANMQEGRLYFGCGVMDGKIYVFEGLSYGRSEGFGGGSEMYDPEANAWSSIAPMITLRSFHDVSAIGEELYAFSGQSFDKKTDDLQERGKLEVYHPGRNDWREVEPYPLEHSLTWPSFLVGGKLHRLRFSRIQILDMDNNSATWRDLHSFEVIGRTLIVSAVNGELWAMGHLSIHGMDEDIFQSRGFGSKNRVLVWEKVDLPVVFEHCRSAFICPAQL